MRPFLFKLVSLIIFLCINVAVTGEVSTKEESKIIRRLFLDIKYVPPTPDELNWLFCYNNDPYYTAVVWVINDPNNLELKKYLLSNEYRNSPSTKLNQEVLDYIIKYQCGNVKLNIDEADKLLIKHAIAYGQGNLIESIDYLSLCLTAKATNTEEINELLKTFRQYISEEEGYLAVLNVLKMYKDYYMK